MSCARACVANRSPAESSYNGFWFAVDDREQDAGCAVGHPPSLFPFLNGPYMEAETVGELLAAQLHPLAQRQDVLGGRVVDDSAGKGSGGTHMGEHFAESSLQLVSQDQFAGSSSVSLLLLDRGIKPPTLSRRASTCAAISSIERLRARPSTRAVVSSRGSPTGVPALHETRRKRPGSDR